MRDEPPSGDEWLHELKLDGYRIEAIIAGGDVRLMTRGAKDWTDRYPAVARALARLDVDNAVFDGELVAVDGRGHSRFDLLQKASEGGGVRLRYYAFDLLHLDGRSLLSMPLVARKERLRSLIPMASGPLHYSDHIQGEGGLVIRKACAMNLEGIISKKASAPYRSGRGPAWIKSKCVGNDEFVIGGYRRSDKRGRPFSSLLLGEFVDGRLVYRGRVGAGFDARTLDELRAWMGSMERSDSPFDATPAEARRQAVWVEPRLVAQIAYTERTSAGILRHPRFLGLREDRPAREVTGMGSGRPAGTAEFRGVRLTNPDRVLYPGQGVTKRAVAAYYDDVADAVLAHLSGRPVSLVRCPEGRQRECFFQKHHAHSIPEQIDAIEVQEKSGSRKPYLAIGSADGLVAAAQIGTLELHVWGGEGGPHRAAGAGRVRSRSWRERWFRCRAPSGRRPA